MALRLRTVAAGFLASIAFAQVPAEVATRDVEMPATFRTAVKLVLVPVVVRDKKGKAIGTLNKEDFELYDKGKLQIIAKFSLEKAGSQNIEFEPTPPPDPSVPLPSATSMPAVAGRYTIFLFDDLNINLADLMNVRQAAEKHLQTALLPTERIAVFTTSGRISSPFTDDRDAIIFTMRRIHPVGRAASNRRGCPR